MRLVKHLIKRRGRRTASRSGWGAASHNTQYRVLEYSIHNPRGFVACMHNGRNISHTPSAWPAENSRASFLSLALDDDEIGILRPWPLVVCAHKQPNHAEPCPLAALPMFRLGFLVFGWSLHSGIHARTRVSSGLTWIGFFMQLGHCDAGCILVASLGLSKEE